MANQSTQEPTTWPEFAVGLFEQLTGRGAQITYEFDNLELFIPNKVGSGANHAHWKLNGTLNVRTAEHTGGNTNAGRNKRND